MFQSLENNLEELARELRFLIIDSIAVSGSGHIGGSLSCVEILLSLYAEVLKHDPANPRWELRDRFILSKGHAEAVYYGTLCLSGYIPREWLLAMRKFGSPLQGHPDPNWLDAVNFAGGSLGQGLSFAAGQAIQGKKVGFRAFALLGDGELQEGQIWEAAIFAPKYKLDNLFVFVDCNGYQLEGIASGTANPVDIKQAWEGFGWNVHIIDGHDFGGIRRACIKVEGKPTLILAKTIKGKGISYMEHNNDFHGRGLTAKEIELAYRELS
jgi:transketolase